MKENQHALPKHLRYGVDVNRYDLLKLVAILAMLLDHLGALFYPDCELLRAVGRVSFPIFFLLIGWSRSTRIGRPLLIYAVILALAAMLLGLGLLPLNILFTVLFALLAMRVVERYGWLENQQFGLLIAGLIWLPLGLMLDYGSFALLWVLVGSNLRDGRQDPIHMAVMFITVAGYFLLQGGIFTELGSYLIYAVIYIVGLVAVLQMLRGDLMRAAPKLINYGLLRKAARYSLELYVLHLLLFWMVAALTGDIMPGFSWFGRYAD